MTNMPPSDPRSSRRNLDFDEFIGILVAFTTIGAILFWSFSRRNATGWDFNLFPPTTQPSAEPGTNNLPNNLLPLQPNVGVSPNVQPNGNSNLNVLPPASPPVNEQETPSVPNNGILGGIPPQVVIPPQVGQSQIIPPVTKVPPRPFDGVTTPVGKLPIIPPPRAFTDVPNDFWAKGFIDALSSRKIIEGFEDYSFRPNQPITRAEFAAILERAFNKETGQSQLSFTDITQKYWATAAINDAIAKGFLKGYPDKTFKPEQKIPRVQVLVALVSGLNLKTPSSPDKVVSIFKDAKDIPKYAIDRVAAASVDKLVVNYPDKLAFTPNREATRAEVAAMIHQALVRMGRLQPIQSENIITVVK
jgi:S-layer homology domain